jgi:hypothetical protein
MPSPPPAESFRVTTTVPKELLGEAIAALTKLGLNDVAFDLVTDVRTYAKNPPGISTGVIEKWVEDHPTFRALDVVKHFRETGRGNGTAAYPALAILVEKGFLKKLSPGNYARADIKHLAAPKKAAPKPGKHDPQDRREIDHREFVLKLARRNHGRFNTPWLKREFEKDARKASAVSPTLARLLHLKKIKRVGEGEYVLLNKAVTRKKPKPVAPVVSDNVEVADG